MLINHPQGNSGNNVTLKQHVKPIDSLFIGVQADWHNRLYAAISTLKIKRYLWPLRLDLAR